MYRQLLGYGTFSWPTFIPHQDAGQRFHCGAVTALGVIVVLGPYVPAKNFARERQLDGETAGSRPIMAAIEQAQAHEVNETAVMYKSIAVGFAFFTYKYGTCRLPAGRWAGAKEWALIIAQQTIPPGCTCT